MIPLIYFPLIIAAFALPILCFLLGLRQKLKKVPIKTQNMPSITVSMPIYGSYDSSQDAKWKAIIQQEYDGPVTYAFVCESTADQAFSRINEFIDQQKEISNLQVLVSGLSFHNSQKIHNMLVGFQAFPADYYVCLDDDISINPFLVQELVNSLVHSRNKKARVATGYSAEIPVDGRLSSYLVGCYRLMNCFSFIAKRVPFYWGGCFAFSRETEAELSLFELWTAGCYSEDMSGSARLREQKYEVVNPDLGMFANLIQGLKFKNYFDFVGRQFFVLKCYFTRAERNVNLLTACVLFVFSGFVWITLGGIFLDLWGVYQRFKISKQKVVYFDQLLNRSFLVFVCLNVMGYALKFALLQIYTFQLRVLGQEKKPDKRVLRLNHMKLITMLILHELFTPLICIKYLSKQSVVWAKSTFTVINGVITNINKRGVDHSYADSLDNFRRTGLGIQALVPDVKQKV